MVAREEARKTRQAILMAAFELMHRNGFRATGLNDIIAKTGLTKGAFYHHFLNKTALGYAIVDELLTFMVNEFWLKPLDGAEDPLARLQEVLMTTKTDLESVTLGCPLNNFAVEMAPVDEGFRLRVEKVYDLWIDGYTKALTNGQQKGKVSRNIDPRRAAKFIVAAFAGCRGRAKNMRSREELLECHEQLNRYLETLRP